MSLTDKTEIPFFDFPIFRYSREDASSLQTEMTDFSNAGRENVRQQSQQLGIAIHLLGTKTQEIVLSPQDLETPQVHQPIGSSGPQTGSTGDGTGSTEDQTGSTGAKTGSTEAKTGSTELQTGSTEVQTGSTEAKTGSTGAKTGSSGAKAGSTEDQIGSTGAKAGSTGAKAGSTGAKTGSSGAKAGSTEVQTGSTELQTESTELQTESTELQTESTEDQAGSTGAKIGSTEAKTGSSGARANTGSTGDGTGSTGAKTGSTEVQTGSTGAKIGSSGAKTGSSGAKAGSTGTGTRSGTRNTRTTTHVRRQTVSSTRSEHKSGSALGYLCLGVAIAIAEILYVIFCVFVVLPIYLFVFIVDAVRSMCSGTPMRRGFGIRMRSCFQNYKGGRIWSEAAFDDNHHRVYMVCYILCCVLAFCAVVVGFVFLAIWAQNPDLMHHLGHQHGTEDDDDFFSTGERFQNYYPEERPMEMPIEI